MNAASLLRPILRLRLLLSYLLLVPFALNAQLSAPAEPSQVVTLNPFEVQADSDQSYGALNSNSVTAFNTELDKLPISADIYDQAFIHDTGSTTVESMIESYSAGAGTANSNGGFQSGDRGGAVMLRGLPTATMVRDGFMQMGAYGNPGSTGNGVTSTFDVERAEIINGPQSLLYGGGGAGGIINVVSKQARLDKPAFGSVQFQVDQYGGKMGEFDAGAGNDRLAVRVAILDQKVGGRRLYLGGSLDGYYVQFAWVPIANTTIRLTADQTTFNRINNDNTKLTLTAASTSNDARNSQDLNYLLATNQIAMAAAGAPSGAGVIDNGNINWGNVDSFGAWWQSELTINEFVQLDVETKWNSWLSTKLDLGYNDYYDDWVHPGVTFYAPNNSKNTLGVWAASTVPVAAEEPGRTKAIRFSALASNTLFGGAAHSQTIVGADFSRHNDEAGKVDYAWYQADSNWNIITTPGASNDGRTAMGAQFWPVANGPIPYPVFNPAQKRVTIGGVNYVRAIENEINPAFISPSNPLGVTLSSSNDYSQTLTLNRGVYGVNYTNWLGGKLDTLIGFRLAQYSDRVQGAGTVVQVAGGAPLVSGATQLVTANAYGFNVGADYAVRPWLHPYITVSDSYNPPATLTTDAIGNITPIARSLGEELGVKVQNASGTISGSLALYRVSAKNDEFQVTTSLVSDINPSGLNGVYGSPSQWITVDRVSQGAQAILIAAPVSNWRIRISAAVVNGKINSNTSYGQRYNDQFNENSQGQVTYADGTVVFVPATFNSKQLTVASGTAGAVPLTATLLSTPTSAYFASPAQVNGQILASSNGGQVLINGATSPLGQSGHGSILTGVAGLPISSEQLNLGLAGVTVPGTIVTSQAGQLTSGYPEFSTNATSVYTIPAGWAKGFKFGGTASLGWEFRDYYYYPTGFTPGATQTLFKAPIVSRFDLILGYTHKFHRVTWDAQINVSNVFNRYSILILPSATAGYSGINNATFSQQPRAYVLRNTLSF